MDIDVARHMVRAGLRSGLELEALIGALKVACGPEEYREHLRAIAVAIDAIQTATMNKAFALYPQLEAEVDAQIQKYGRYL